MSRSTLRSSSPPRLVVTSNPSFGGTETAIITTSGREGGNRVYVPRKSNEVAFSSFEAPSSGTRSKRKSSHVRVVARIRPLNSAEVARGCVPTIFPLLQQRNDAAEGLGSPTKRRSQQWMQANSNTELVGQFGTPPRVTAKKSTTTPISGGSCPTPTHRNTNASLHTQPSSPSNDSPTSAVSDIDETEWGNALSLVAGISQQKRFDYDAVFDPSASQNEVYNRSVGDAVRRNVFRGYNTTIIAYGQTGSGKTHTMSGRHEAEMECELQSEKIVSVGFSSPSLSPTKPKKESCVRSMDLGNRDTEMGSCSKKNTAKQKHDKTQKDLTKKWVSSDEHMDMASFAPPAPYSVSKDDGIVPRAVHELFKAKQRHCSSGDVCVNLTYLEIYNDELRDLLTENEQSKSLQIRDHGDSGVIVKGLTSKVVTTPQEVKQLMDMASRRRTTGSTKMNMRSSRSHAICTLYVTIKPTKEKMPSKKFNNLAASDTVSAKLTLVDLAGSERLKQTGAEGIQQQESININKDLFVLGKVVSALADQSDLQTKEYRPSLRPKKKHIPYRDSKLTRLLRDSLGGNCCTVMVACISPADSNLAESVNTLRYAERTRTITNSVKQNVVKAALTPAESAALRKENKILKAKLIELTKNIQMLEGLKAAQTHPRQSSGANGDDAAVGADGVTSPREKSSVLKSNNVIADSRSAEKSDADDLLKASVEWKTKYEKLLAASQAAGFENAHDHVVDENEQDVLELQRREIVDLKQQLHRALFGSDDDDDETDETSVTSGTTHDEISLFDVDGMTEDESLSRSDTCSLNNHAPLTSVASDSESDSILVATKKNLETDISEMNASRDRLEDEVFQLQEKVDALDQQARNMRAQAIDGDKRYHNIGEDQTTLVKESRESLECESVALKMENRALATENKKIADHLKKQRKEITMLAEQIIMYKTQIDNNEPKERERNAQLDAEMSEKEARKEQLNKETMEMKQLVQTLVTERTELMEQVKQCKDISTISAQLTEERSARIQHEEGASKLRKEVEAVTEERDTYRVKAMVQEDEIRKLKEELTSLRNTNEIVLKKPGEKENERLIEQRKDALDGKNRCNSPQSVFKGLGCGAGRFTIPAGPAPRGVLSDRNICSERNSGKAAIDGESSSSVLFGQEKNDSGPTPHVPQSDSAENSSDETNDRKNVLPGDSDSVKSEQHAIRIHAAKMLFWANKAIERQKSHRSSSGSAASSIGSYNMPPSPAVPLSKKVEARNSGDMAAKSTLPPRIVVRNKSLSQPRPEEGSDSTGRTEPKDPPSMISVGACTFDEKENLRLKTSMPPLGLCQNKDVIDAHKSSQGNTELAQSLRENERTCQCSASMFSGNSQHVEFFLPKLGMACSCGQSKKTDTHNKEYTSSSNSPLSLSNILRPWQVEFLESLDITRADQLVRAYKRRGRELSKEMRVWRHEKEMKPVKTKSCFVALHIWARTAKMLYCSVTQKVAAGVDPVSNPNFLEISVMSDTRSVSTLGFGSIVDTEGTMEI